MTESEYREWCDGNRAFLATDPPEYDPDIDDDGDVDEEMTISGDTLEEWQMPF